jgi:hypothetical protein
MWRRGKQNFWCRWVLVSVSLVLIALYIPPLRNLLLWPVFPPAWRQLSFYEVGNTRFA